MNLKHRIKKIEAGFKPPDLRAVIQGFLADSAPSESAFAPASLDSDDPRLQQGVDDDGEAIISRWWAVTFIDGTREQQETRLKELRVDPTFQAPWAQNGPLVCFEGGASCDDIFLRIHEKEQKEKPRSNEQKLLRSDSA
jgi:hypothetical protein